MGELDRLKDIVEPGAILWWQPTGVFLILVVLLTVNALSIYVYIYYRKRRNLYKQEAIALIRAATHSGQINRVLKQVLFVHYPREEVASLAGEEWLTFLNRQITDIDFLENELMLQEALTEFQEKAIQWVQKLSYRSQAKNVVSEGRP